MVYITEPAKKIPVYADVDVCVVGGSATGVFAAVRAARLGAKVILVEKMNGLGGVATNGMVNVWHSYNDTEGKNQIISGLTEEVTDRLHALGAEFLHGGSKNKPYDWSHKFNTCELKIELDKLLAEAGVESMFHTMYVGVSAENGHIDAIFIENKDGRQAIRAKFFIDASGDGDICRDMDIEAYRNANIQPPSPVYLLQGKFSQARGGNVGQLIAKYPGEVDLAPDWGWSTVVPGLKNIIMHADTHIFGVECDRATDLTKAEIEGRRQIREIVRLIRNHGSKNETYGVAAMYSHIGIRDTVHYKTAYQAQHCELMLGTRYDDCILNGTYVSDVHLADGGITFRHFNGRYITEYPDGTKKRGSWWKEMGVPHDHAVPTYYSLPFRVLVGDRCDNLIAAGRMLNADQGAFGALRVMVNLNQIGEAAGVAAYLAINENKKVCELDGVKVARTLSAGGSANLG